MGKSFKGIEKWLKGSGKDSRALEKTQELRKTLKSIRKHSRAPKIIGEQACNQKKTFTAPQRYCKGFS
ncbi:hypothetical protein DMA11_13320 [Marinilabiliaceae bacterium JC017]|nr:hypothetical protein DMA11_13320 [Marinilabiliaceae bacterium JC017]